MSPSPVQILIIPSFIQLDESAVEDKTLPFSLLCRSPGSGSPAKDAPGSQDGLQLMLGPLGSHSCRLLRVTWRWYGPCFGTLVHCWRWAIAALGVQ